MGDRVVNELVALFVFLKRAVQSGEDKDKERGKKAVAEEERERVTDFCRHLTVQV
jgi:hypothetical protein